mgnify:FL=1
MKRVGWLLVILGLVGSLLVAWQRAGWEEQTYTLSYDYSEALSLARFSGNSITKTLKSLGEAGVRSVAISQYTAGEAARQGKLLLWDGTAIAAGGLVPSKLQQITPLPGRLYIMAQDAAVAADLAALLPDLGGQVLDEEQNLWQLPGSLSSFLDQPLGLPQEKLKLARSLGLAIIVRLENDHRLSLEGMDYLLSSAAGAQALLCKGKEVFGYPGKLSHVARRLTELELPYAIIEFSKQNGQEQLASLIAPQVLRLHTIPRAELDKMDQQKAQERLVRAATERSIPLLYLRPLLTEKGDLLAANVSFVRKLNARLQDLGYNPESAMPRPPWESSRLLFYLVALAPIGACLIVFSWLPQSVTKILLSLLFLAWLGLPLLSILRARQLFALFAAIVFPLLAVVGGNRYEGLLRACIAGLIALFGGLVVSALLGSWQFALALWRFAGVKVAFVVPLGLVGLWAFSPLAEGKGWQEFKKWAEEQLSSPIRVWHLLFGLILAVIMAIYLLRSGNTGLAPQWERTLRETLERAFRYRPRTKEFLFGYPLLVLGFSLKQSWGQRLCVTLGTVGLVSTINSFAHAHSPLVASLIRSFWGLTLGIALGWLLTFVVKKLLSVMDRG